jgi:hypothetical protein
VEKTLKKIGKTMTCIPISKYFDIAFRPMIHCAPLMYCPKEPLTP